MTSCLISLQNVSLGYSGQLVVENISFEIVRGELIALLGPNGAGKTTLLRGILGLLPVTRGQIQYELDPRQEPLGYVPQQETLDPIFPLTAFEVVLMGTYARLGLFGRISQREKNIALSCLEQVGMSDKSEERFSVLSGGQKQRVLIARALAVDPQILLLDEPTAGVDPGAEALIMTLIKDLNRTRRLTVVLVSHHLGLVRSFIETVVWVNGGTAIKGTTQQMLTPQRIEAIFNMVEAAQ